MSWYDWDVKYTAALISSVVSASLSYFISTTVSKSNILQIKVSNICNRIESIIIIASIYWKKPGNDPDAETRLKAELQCIAHDIFDFNKKDLKENNVDVKLIMLRKDITNGDFECKNKKADPQREKNIAESAHAFRDAIKLCKL